MEESILSQNLPAKIEEWQLALKQKLNTIQALLPANTTNARRLCISAMQSVMRNDKLLACNKDSFIFAVLSAAEFGLDLGMIQHAALVPYKGQVTLQLMYKGLLELARRSGQLSIIDADVVREGDLFEFEKGLDMKLRHIPALENEKAPITHAYAVAVLKDGGKQFAVMTRAQVETVRNASPYGKSESSPWNGHWAEMAKKTVLKRLVKLLPASMALQAAEVDSRAEQGKLTVPSMLELSPAEFELVEPKLLDGTDTLNAAISAANAPEIPKEPEPVEEPVQEKKTPQKAQKRKPATSESFLEADKINYLKGNKCFGCDSSKKELHCDEEGVLWCMDCWPTDAAE